MSGITDLEQLLKRIQPQLQAGEFVFCTVAGPLTEFLPLAPIASFKEAEGLTLVLTRTAAEAAGLPFEGFFRQITLNVHSSLEAVGLTATVATRLAAEGISANVIAAFYHDHIFVPAAKAEQALVALAALSC
ncbi:ACT domain-containing protein [Halioxenophilus sp. WMMB6]|uniref:ACT domain-containing protein n=1 Tax=Halioxenophilus sp. WMMB6 TaxID=3073815 RepID=UPI00295E46B7|nr:ACT domain-containing protein [Halioxenophilus sp. WMMB6]